MTEEIRFISFGGDGATYDIGFQSLSGAIERGHDFLYVCFNNEAYMNTGIQRSGATGRGAQTTTCPAGTCIPGKREFPKDLTKIIIAHDLPYAAQGSPHNWKDLIEKARKGFEANGPAFLNVIAPCPRGWRYDPSLDHRDGQAGGGDLRLASVRVRERQVEPDRRQQAHRRGLARRKGRSPTG